MSKFTIFSLFIYGFFSLITLSAAQTGGATSSVGGGGGSGGGVGGGVGQGVNVELWCVAKNNAEDAVLQSALDWACGPGGANCGPIQPGGPCYDISDIQQTASYAFNDYFLRHGLSEDSCKFDNSAALTSLNPSRSNCKFPSSLSVNNGSYSSTVSGITGPASADLSNSNSITKRSNLALIIILLFFTMPLVFRR